MKVLGYHISEKGAVNSDREEPGCLSLVEYLLKSKEDTIRVIYDLDYSGRHILHSLKLTTREASTLIETTKFNLSPYYLRYVVGKFLSIKRSNGFAYYSNASQYAKHAAVDLTLSPLNLAERAKATGEMVVSILHGLGIEATSLNSPARAYEKSQVEFLFRELQNTSENEIKRSIVDSIGLEVFGRIWETRLRR